ncbi:MAG TPA: class I mannose-6-phosphate isomerase [Candidatus Hydrogenedentes bacterium]|nr:class I mannose-6-phosphate isomerase [Candidatus Hydrogenedentota bacterium]
MNVSPASRMDPLRFEEAYFQRIWGGERLKKTLGKKTPQEAIIGEAWLISDHPHCESRVADGPHQGKTLRELLVLNAPGILGKRAQLTPQGRFPLLLKLIDTGDILSVQVHPADEDALRLKESDSGKTEMWHVLDADPGAELICGLIPNISPAAFQQALANHRLTECMTRFPAPADTNVFVPAGTVHAIGKGILLAEIQQNSDLTYRVYDWDRVDASGKPRPLHVEKAMAVIRFGAGHNGPSQPLAYELNGASCSILAACHNFAAELLSVTDSFTRALPQDSFHLLLVKNGPLTVQGLSTEYTLKAGEAILIPGSSDAYTIHGSGTFLDYYVPDLTRDIAEPLLRAGHSKESISHLIEKQ